MINKYQLPTSLTLKVNTMKDECVKCLRDSKIITSTAAGDNEGESEFQRVNLKDIKTWFESKESGSDKSQFSRTMLGGHSNEEKITRSMEA